MVQHDALYAQGEELSLEVAYKKRLFSYLLALGIPFIVGCAVAALVLRQAANLVPERGSVSLQFASCENPRHGR
jgi:hypothetical protein